DQQALFRGAGQAALQEEARWPDHAVADPLRPLGHPAREGLSAARSVAARRESRLRLPALLQQLQRQLGAVRRLVLGGDSERAQWPLVQERGVADGGARAAVSRLREQEPALDRLLLQCVSHGVLERRQGGAEREDRPARARDEDG